MLANAVVNASWGKGFIEIPGLRCERVRWAYSRRRTRAVVSPKAARPPSTLNSTSSKGIFATPLMISGRTRLSIQLIASAPHNSRPMPAPTSPFNSSHPPIEPQTKGAPKGMRATTAVAAARRPSST